MDATRAAWGRHVRRIVACVADLRGANGSPEASVKELEVKQLVLQLCAFTDAYRSIRVRGGTYERHRMKREHFRHAAVRRLGEIARRDLVEDNTGDRAPYAACPTPLCFAMLRVPGRGSADPTGQRSDAETAPVHVSRSVVCTGCTTEMCFVCSAIAREPVQPHLGKCMTDSTRRHVAQCQDLLNTKCPRCSAVIHDFDGCFAVTHNCGGTRGTCMFCGFCMMDC